MPYVPSRVLTLTAIRSPPLPSLAILYELAWQVMIERLGCPPRLRELVEELWFDYLEVWARQARYPIVQCFIPSKELEGHQDLEEVLEYQRVPAHKPHAKSIKKRPAARAVLTKLLGHDDAESFDGGGTPGW